VVAMMRKGVRVGVGGFNKECGRTRGVVNRPMYSSMGRHLSCSSI